MTAGRPLRGPDRGKRRLRRRHLQGRAAALWLGDAPREGTGPPLSVKAGCDRRATADRPAAWHRYTRSPALSAEPPAAPRAGEAGRPRPAPPQGAARPVTAVALRTSGRPGNEVNWRSIIRRGRKNYTNSGPGSQPGNLTTAEPTWRSCVTQNQVCMKPGMLQTRPHRYPTDKTAFRGTPGHSW